MSNYCIMNLKKVNASDSIRGLQEEANREYEDISRYRNNVDLSRSHLNVTLVHSDDWKESIYGEIEKAGLSVSKDSVLAITAVYTASPEWFEAHPDKQEQLAYFQDCIAFHEKRFGKVVNAVVHYDEGTPHMQVISVPIIEVPKVENYWICKADGKEVTPDDKARWGAKDSRKRKQRHMLDENGNKIMSIGLNGARALGGKKKLSHLQDEFAEECGYPYGMERGECRIDTDEKAEHKTALQHEVEELEEQAEGLEEKCRKIDAEIERKMANAKMHEDAAMERNRQSREDKARWDAQKAQEEAEIRAKAETYDNLIEKAKNALKTAKPDDDMSRKTYMLSIRLSDGSTAEEGYQKMLADRNRRVEKAKAGLKRLPKPDPNFAKLPPEVRKALLNTENVQGKQLNKGMEL